MYNKLFIHRNKFTGCLGTFHIIYGSNIENELNPYRVQRTSKVITGTTSPGSEQRINATHRRQTRNCLLCIAMLPKFCLKYLSL